MAEVDRLYMNDSPTRMRALNRMTVVSVAAGRSNSFAITEHGGLYTWGGTNDDTWDVNENIRFCDLDFPERVRPLEHEVVIAISVTKAKGQGHTMVATRSGNVYGCPGGAVQSVSVSRDGMIVQESNWRLYANTACSRRSVAQGE